MFCVIKVYYRAMFFLMTYYSNIFLHYKTILCIQLTDGFLFATCAINKFHTNRVFFVLNRYNSVKIIFKRISTFPKISLQFAFQ